MPMIEEEVTSAESANANLELSTNSRIDQPGTPQAPPLNDSSKEVIH